jgi:hypothetical protein
MTLEEAARSLEKMFGALEGIESLSKSLPAYRREIAALARQLWSTNITPFEFVDNMFSAMRRNFTFAWRDGAKSVGVKEIPDEAVLKIQDFTQEQAQYLPGFSDFIVANNKASGAKLNSLDVRIDMWANRYQEVVNMARLYHIENQPLEWVMNPQKEHCTDCMNLSGRVYSKKTWDKYGLHPQMHELECRGYRCGCKFAKTDKPLTPGHPPALIGKSHAASFVSSDQGQDTGLASIQP